MDDGDLIVEDYGDECLGGCDYSGMERILTDKDLGYILSCFIV